MALGLTARALARRRYRAILLILAGMLDFSAPNAGALLALLTEDF